MCIYGCEWLRKCGVSAVLLSICLFYFESSAANEKSEQTAKKVGHAVGSAARDIGKGAKKAGKVIGKEAKKVGKTIGRAAKAGGQEFNCAVKDRC